MDARLHAAVLRTDFPAFHQKVFKTLKPGTTFIPNWHHEHLAYKFEQVREGSLKRLIVNVPPRSGKSIMSSVAFPMFVMGHDPSAEFLAISHTDKLARDFSIYRRTISQQDWYRDLFPDLEWTARRTMDLTTNRGGRIFATGTGGAVLGKGANYILIDDPLDGSAAYSEVERRKFSEFYDNTLSSRLNNKTTGAIVLIMQRLHEDDATGHLLSKEDFDVVSIPAIAPEAQAYVLSDTPGDIYRRRKGEVLDPTREPLQVLDTMRHVQGAMHFQAQYQQQPVPASGNAIKREWLRYYDEAPAAFDRKIVSWDTASTLGDASDYSVGMVWASKGLDFYLLDLVRGRFEAPELRRQILALHALHQADATLIEDTELGRAVAQELRAAQSLRPLLEPSRESKEARLLAQSAKFETGCVLLPRDATSLAEYVHELLAFPSGKHDDQVDATSQALRYLTSTAAAFTPHQRPARKRRQASAPRPLGAPQRRR